MGHVGLGNGRSLVVAGTGNMGPLGSRDVGFDGCSRVQFYTIACRHI